MTPREARPRIIPWATTRPPTLLTIGAVARETGLSIVRLRQLDAVLAPARTSSGQRLYDREVLERFMAERAARGRR